MLGAPPSCTVVPAESLSASLFGASALMVQVVYPLVKTQSRALEVEGFRMSRVGCLEKKSDRLIHLPLLTDSS